MHACYICFDSLSFCRVWTSAIHHPCHVPMTPHIMETYPPPPLFFVSAFSQHSRWHVPVVSLVMQPCLPSLPHKTCLCGKLCTCNVIMIIAYTNWSGDSMSFILLKPHQYCMQFFVFLTWVTDSKVQLSWVCRITLSCLNLPVFKSSISHHIPCMGITPITITLVPVAMSMHKHELCSLMNILLSGILCFSICLWAACSLDMQQVLHNFIIWLTCGQ